MISFFIAAMAVFGAQAQSSTESSSKTNVYYETDVWYGPGYYNGIWFGSEDEFNDWHVNNYHDAPHQHTNGGQDHGQQLQDRAQDRQFDDRGERGGGGGRGGGGHR